MIPKVKIRSDIFESGDITYTVRSKDLVAALERATLIVAAVGSRLRGFEYALDESHKKQRHHFYIYA